MIKRKENKVSVSVRIDPETLKSVDHVAMMCEVTRTDVVQAALESFCGNYRMVIVISYGSRRWYFGFRSVRLNNERGLENGRSSYRRDNSCVLDGSGGIVWWAIRFCSFRRNQASLEGTLNEARTQLSNFYLHM